MLRYRAHQPHFFIINEIEKVELLYIPKDEITRLAKKDPLIYKWILDIVSENVPHWFQSHLISMSKKDVRVLYCLATLLPIYENKLKEISLNVTQQDVSNLCGVTRPRVNEVLKKFESQGFIKLKRKMIVITSIKLFFELLGEVDLSFYDPRVRFANQEG